MGLTECASVAFANPLEPAARRYGSPGLPLGVEARVVEPRRRRARAPASAARSSCAATTSCCGYYKSPDATAAALRPRRLAATGDLGYRDADGFYFITGRLKELIIKGGENIAPREIDEALLAHPAVLEAAAVGVPDAAYGQEILACVVVKPGAACTEDELRAHCLRDARPLQVAALPAPRRRAAEGPVGQGAAAEAARVVTQRAET